MFKLHDSKIEEIFSLDTGLEVVKCLNFHPQQELIGCGVGPFCAIYSIEHNEYVSCSRFCKYSDLGYVD
jgi:hypothetical protein